MTDSPYGDDELEDLRNRLFWARDRTANELRNLEGEAMRPSTQNGSLDHLAEFGTDNFEQELDLALLEDEATALRETEEALARIDGRGDYEYGKCEACAEEPKRRCATCPWIPVERLRYIPWARHCVAVQEALERGEPT